MAEDPYKYFRIEARELVEEIGRGVLELEKGGSSGEIVARLLRFAHTMKGAARVVKQREIADHAHAMEDALALVRDAAPAPPAREHIDAILALVDAISGRVSGLPGGPGAAVPRDASKPVLEETQRSVRMDVAEIDTMLDGIAETHAYLTTLRKSLASTEQARHLIDLLINQIDSRASKERSAAAAGSGERLLSMAEELRSAFVRIDQGLVTTVDHIDREIGQLRDATERLRLIPAATMFTSLERTARDTAQALGTEVQFVATGGEVRIDAHVASAAQAALVQLVRNAVAHGIEPPSARRAAGKPAAGSIVVDVSRRGRRLFLRCKDDGRGIDVNAVRRAAARGGTAETGVRELDTDAVLRLLLRGGISTSSSVTEVSGRGVGLDVVRETAERLGGELRVETQPGLGTIFELSAPLSLASLDALLVESAGAVAAIPLDAVRRTLRVQSGALSRTAEGEALIDGDEVIPFVPLPSVLGRTVKARTTRAVSGVIVSAGGRTAAIGVDRLLGTRSIVVRPLPELAPAHAVIAGASLDIAGNAQLVLDPEGVVEEACNASLLETPSEAPGRVILVIDDSLTTRMLEQSILESAGYKVDLAVSAEEGLERARRKRYALFLVDVEMPGMDGFSFVEQIRGDPLLRDVPAILVTSRSAAEDRRRGVEVGAQGYVVKSEFDQADLLHRIERLVFGS